MYVCVVLRLGPFKVADLLYVCVWNWPQGFEVCLVAVTPPDLKLLFTSVLNDRCANTFFNYYHLRICPFILPGFPKSCNLASMLGGPGLTSGPLPMSPWSGRFYRLLSLLRVHIQFLRYDVSVLRRQHFCNTWHPTLPIGPTVDVHTDLTRTGYLAR